MACGPLTLRNVQGSWGHGPVHEYGLSTLVKYYLQSKFMTFSGGIRPTLMPGKEFLTSHIENNERLLKKESLEISDLSALRTWRLANENQVLGEEVQALMAANRPGGKKRKA